MHPQPLAAVRDVKLKRQSFNWRRPFRRRLYVLTFSGQREASDKWEAYVLFHRTVDAALAVLNHALSLMNEGEPA